MQVSGDAMIFRNAHEGKDGTWYTYATGVSSKKQDGTYANMYLDVRFRKGVTVENKTRIDIKDGFLTVKEFIASGGETVKKLELMILDFDVKGGGFTAMSDEDVPF